jgi:C-terminal processing protease CtpA/Prc
MPTYGYTNSNYIYIQYIQYSLNFADDQVLLAQDHDDMEYMARKLKEEYEKWGLAINLEKTKYVCIGEGK